MDRNRLKLVILMTVIFLPITLATYTFVKYEGKGFGFTTNKGRLISPVLDITELGLLNEDNEPAFVPFEDMVAGIAPRDYTPRPWMLVMVGTPSCDEDCRQRLYYLRQLHVRLGADALRVQRVYAVADDGRIALDLETERYLREDMAGIQVYGTQQQALRETLARTHDIDEDPIADNFIYLVDPVGNIMLYFTPENGPEDILSDVDNLLDRSSLG